MLKELRKHIEKQFNIVFKDEELLLEAFTHSSYANDHRDKNVKNLERLEFLGDAVIELSVSRYLYLQYPDLPEGNLTRMRAALVRAESLAELTKEADLARFIRLGKGEEQMNGRNRTSLLCDVFEAFVGALYLDQGIERVIELLEQIMFPKIVTDGFSHGMDYKTTLQEHIQKNGVVQISYQVIDTNGPDHDRAFVVEVLIEGDRHGVGRGRSKKLAEQHAAQNALARLKES